MKSTINHCLALMAVIFFAANAATAQSTKLSNKSTSSTMTELKTFVIERELPGASKLTAEQLKAIAKASCGVLKEMGPKIQWVHSYVAGDKLYCIYKAESEELIWEHARKGNFPCNKVSELATMISPATAD